MFLASANGHARFDGMTSLESIAPIPENGSQGAGVGRDTTRPGNSAKIRVQIIQEDIDAWQTLPGHHPLLDALKRITHTPWRLIESIIIVEKVPPYRTVVLHCGLLMKLLDCKNGDASVPFEEEIELLLPFQES